MNEMGGKMLIKMQFIIPSISFIPLIPVQTSAY